MSRLCGLCKKPAWKGSIQEVCRADTGSVQHAGYADERSTAFDKHRQYKTTQIEMALERFTGQQKKMLLLSLWHLNFFIPLCFTCHCVSSRTTVGIRVVGAWCFSPEGLNGSVLSGSFSCVLMSVQTSLKETTNTCVTPGFWVMCLVTHDSTELGF